MDSTREPAAESLILADKILAVERDGDERRAILARWIERIGVPETIADEIRAAVLAERERSLRHMSITKTNPCIRCGAAVPYYGPIPGPCAAAMFHGEPCTDGMWAAADPDARVAERDEGARRDAEIRAAVRRAIAAAIRARK